jgi:hypothetical protein
VMEACLTGLLPELDLGICNSHSYSLGERQNDILNLTHQVRQL